MIQGTAVRSAPLAADRTSATGAGPLAVAFGGVMKRYGRTVALEGLDLTIQAGETVASAGIFPSLMRIASTTLNPTPVPAWDSRRTLRVERDHAACHQRA